MSEIHTEAARAFFPRGLFQPVGSFRFSLDALLLSAFLTPTRQGRGERLLDIGVGCGVVALAMLLRYPELEALGLDVQPELLDAARQNALHLGLVNRFSALRHDVVAPEVPAELVNAFSLVLANPPYRQRHRGRLPASESRRTALFETEGGLAAFCRVAERALTPEGRFGVIFPAARQEDLLSAFAGAGLTATRLLPVHARETDSAMLILAEARRRIPPRNQRLPCMSAGLNGFAAPEESLSTGPFSEAPFSSSTVVEAPPSVCISLDAPLILYRNRSAKSAFTDQALGFCPFLACNP